MAPLSLPARRPRRGSALLALFALVLVLAGLITAGYLANVPPFGSLFWRSCRPGNEPSAIASLRTLATSEAHYKATEGGGFFTGLHGLHIIQPPYIDAVLSSGRQSGYSFVGATDGARNFTFHAAPLVAGKTGNRRFFVDGSGVVRFNLRGAATSGSTPIE